VGQRGVQGVRQLGGRRRLADPDARAQRHRLDEDGQVQTGQLAQDRVALGAPARVVHTGVIDLWQPGLGHQLLEDELVHADGRGQHPGAHVGDVQALQKPLDRPVLPVGPVEDRKGDVGTQQAVAGSQLDLRSVPAPAPVAGDGHVQDLVALAGQPLPDGGRRGE
jgi:hypothetical protein